MPGGRPWPPGRRGSGAQISEPSPKKRSSRLAQLRVLHGAEQLAQVALEAIEGDLRLDREVVRVVLAVLGGAQPAQLDLRAPAVADLEEAADVDRGARDGQRVERLGVLPGDRLAAAAGVAEHQPQPGLAVALASQLALANRVNPLHPLPVLQLAQRHPGGPGTVPVRRDRLLDQACERFLRHPQPKVETEADDLLTSSFGMHMRTERRSSTFVTSGRIAGERALTATT